MLGKLLAAVGPEQRAVGHRLDLVRLAADRRSRRSATFEITPEYQERFGYPALTPEVKQQILGLNAARLYNIAASRRAAACRGRNSPHVRRTAQ